MDTWRARRASGAQQQQTLTARMPQRARDHEALPRHSAVPPRRVAGGRSASANSARDGASAGAGRRSALDGAHCGEHAVLRPRSRRKLDANRSPALPRSVSSPFAIARRAPPLPGQVWDPRVGMGRECQSASHESLPLDERQRQSGPSQARQVRRPGGTTAPRGWRRRGPRALGLLSINSAADHTFPRTSCGGGPSRGSSHRTFPGS
jgi:hypothetical protein